MAVPPALLHLQRALAELDRRIAEGDPSGELRVQRAGLLVHAGRLTEARDAYAALLAVMPAHPVLLNRLGALHDALGQSGLARGLYREAIRHHPGDPMAYVNLGRSLEKAQEFEEARQHLAVALRLVPEDIEANRTMAYVLTGLGDEAAARPHREKGFRRRPVLTYPYRGDGVALQLLMLASAAGGAVPIRQHIDDRLFAVTVLFVEFFDPAAPLPPHRLIFNAIGDADLSAPALDDAAALLARSTAPVINRPQAVRATGRAGNAARLARIPGLVVPKMAGLPRDALAGAGAEALLDGLGISFPLLLRSPGYHAGLNFVRVETPGGLSEAVARLPGAELVAIEYLDAAGADGKIRKYRVMMIDGVLYPLHAAVSRDWKVHYFSADMAGNADHRAEDQRFLDAMDAVLSADQLRVLADIQAALGLDYGGIDFGIGRDGRVLLFEANATMVVNPVDDDPRWTYRRAPTERVLGAIRALLRDRADLALRTRLEAARTRYEEGDVRGCAALCEEALRHGPPEAALLHLLGLARCGLGMGELGVAMLRQASALAPHDADLRLDMERAVSAASAARRSPAPDEGL